MANKYTPDQLGLKAPSGGFQTGGWYSGRQYWNGTLSDVNTIHPDSNQSGAGSTVSPTVNAASATAQGSTVQDFNQYLSDLSVKDIQPKVTVPYSTGSNGNYISTLNTDVANAKAALGQNITDQRTTIQGQIGEAKVKEAGAIAGIKEATTPFRQTLETNQRQQLGTDQVLADQKSLLGELDQLLTQGNDLIKQQKEVTGLSAIRNPRIQKTMDDISARAGVINAVVSLQNTYLSNAYTSIDRSVNAITQDRQDQLNYYSTILNLANRDIVSLSADDKKLAEQQTNMLADDLKRAQTTSDYIKNLMVNPDTAMALAQSGVSLNDSVQVINQKLATYQYANEIKTMSTEMGKSGYSLVTDPKSVKSDRLITITDTKGNKYYYQKPLSGDGFDASGFMQKLTELGYKVTGAGNDKQAPVIDTGDIWNEILNGSTSTYGGRPAFTPAGGVGTKWTDPSGKNWIYKVNGWNMAN